MNADLIAPSSERSVILRESGNYTAFPRLEQLPDGRLAVGTSVNVAKDHHMLGEWRVVVSSDEGATWSASDDPALPLNWQGKSARERWDRATVTLADGTWLAAGAEAWQAWPAERTGEAREAGLHVYQSELPGHPNVFPVGSNTLFVQRSRDAGRTWERRELDLPRAGWTIGFPRNVVLRSGAVLLPLRQRSQDSASGHPLVMRVTADGSRVRLHPVPRDLLGGTGSEAAFAEVDAGRVLMLIRANANRGGDGRLLASWSDDDGSTWSFPTVTDIWGYPPHLLTLRDGRLLCTYGHRRAPLGVQAALSADGGETWDVQHAAVLVDDSETTDLGYPMSVQLTGDSIFTAYYVTHAGQTYSAGVRWELPW